MTGTIVIAAGGSGGHLFPARELARRLCGPLAQQQIVWMAHGLSQSPFFARGAQRYCDVAAAPPALWPQALARFVWRTGAGLWQAIDLLKQQSCRLLVGFGSYHTLPVMAAALALRIPYLQYAADSVPGRVVRLFAYGATANALQFPGAARYLRGAVNVVRPFAAHAITTMDRSAALHYFGLQEGLPTLLVAGGSQGAAAVNALMVQTLPLLERTPLQVIHLAGRDAVIHSVEESYRRYGVSVCVRAFETNMEAAWLLADLYLGRAGATTVAELSQAAVPALFIPYPQAKDDHQWHNADYYCSQTGLGWAVRQHSATPALLASILQRALGEAAALKGECRRRLLAAQAAMPGLPTLDELVLDHWRRHH